MLVYKQRRRHNDQEPPNTIRGRISLVLETRTEQHMFCFNDVVELILLKSFKVGSRPLNLCALRQKLLSRRRQRTFMNGGKEGLTSITWDRLPDMPMARHGAAATVYNNALLSKSNRLEAMNSSTLAYYRYVQESLHYQSRSSTKRFAWVCCAFITSDG